MENSNMNIIDVFDNFISNDCLDNQIKSTSCLKLLNILLNLKSKRILRKECKEVSFPISHIYEQEVENLNLQCEVLKIALFVSENKDKEINNVITYLNSLTKHFANQPVAKLMKTAKLLNEIISFCKSEKKYFFKKDTTSNIRTFLLHSLIQRNNPIGVYIMSYILHNYLNLLTDVSKLDFLQAIFSQCKVNRNLDVLSTICNSEDIQLLLLNEQQSVLYTDEFWRFLGNSVSCLDNENLQKQAAFILAKWVEVFYNNSIALQLSIPFVVISNMSVQESKKIWQNFFILLDASKEKQLYIIWPTLKLLRFVKYLHPVWQKSIYKILLHHSQNSVIYFVALHILQEGIFFPDLTKYFLSALNKNELSRDYTKIFESLPQYCNTLHEEHFLSFLTDILEVAWVPTAIWCLFGNLFCSKLEKNVPLTFLQPIYKHVKRIPHVYIRNGCIKIFVNHFINNYHWKDNYERVCKMLLILKEYNEVFFVAVVLNHIDACFIDDILNKPEWLLGSKISDLKMFELFIQITKILNHQTGLQVILKHSEKLSDELITTVYANLFDNFCKAEIEKFVERTVYNVGPSCVENFLCIVNNLMKCHEFNERFYTNMVNVLTEPYNYNLTTMYIALYTVINFFKNIDNIKQIVDRWKDKFFTSNKVDDDILILFIELYFLTNENCYDMAFLENAINNQSDLVISKIFEKFSATRIVNDCINNVRFLKIGMNVLQNLTKSRHFNLFVLSYIKSIFSVTCITFLNNPEMLNIITNQINTLLLLSVTSPIVSFYLSSSIRNFIDHYGCDNEYSNIFAPVIIELFLQSTAMKKEERTEYSVCQEVYRKLGNIEDNPNMIKVFTKLYSLESMLQIVNKNMGSADNFAHCLMEKYKVHFNKRYFPDSQIHIQKLRIIQALLSIYPFINTQRHSLINLIMESFCTEIHQPCVKQLMQWLLFSLLKNESNVLNLIISKIKSSTKTQPSTIVAFILVLLHLTFPKTESFWFSTVEALLPWCMGPHFKLRVYSQVAIKTLYEEAKKRSYQNFLSKYNFLEKSINSVIESSGQAFHDTLKSDELFFYDFNPERDYSLQTIYIDIPRLNSVTEIEWENILNYKFSTYESISSLNKDKTFANTVKNTVSTKKSDEEIPSLDIFENSHNIQRKITPWKNTLQEQEVNKELGDFILIASLIEKSTNLGGLSRTCEVFGVKQLILNDAKVTKDKHFIGLSMTSENWVDTLEVKATDLKKFIIEIREKGYCIIGAEQTSGSISLNDYKFKKQTALLLGNEKEGIPPDLISILDACIEIPQFGLVRSLNVHVAGAILIWEYAKQHVVQ